MTSQNFVGDKLVDDFPPQTIQKGDEGDLTKREAQRDPGVEPGANKRAGAASRNPAGGCSTPSYSYPSPLLTMSVQYRL